MLASGTLPHPYVTGVAVAGPSHSPFAGRVPGDEGARGPAMRMRPEAQRDSQGSGSMPAPDCSRGEFLATVLARTVHGSRTVAVGTNSPKWVSLSLT